MISLRHLSKVERLAIQQRDLATLQAQIEYRNRKESFIKKQKVKLVTEHKNDTVENQAFIKQIIQYLEQMRQDNIDGRRLLKRHATRIENQLQTKS